MTIERPMFPPRAESVDSFSHSPVTRQPETAERTSESRNPLGGLSRRGMIAGLAVLPAALPAAAAAMAPQAFERLVDEPALEAEDPAFALIRAKRLADVEHCRAIDAQAVAERVHGFRSDATREAAELSEAACVAANDAAWGLVMTLPTTLAGIVAMLNFANQFEDEGEEWPDTDAVGPGGWHYQLRKAMADAIETIMRQAAGGAA